MSDDSTRSIDGEQTDEDRQHRAAELTAQAQALFSAGGLDLPTVDVPDDDVAQADEDEDVDDENVDVPVVAVVDDDGRQPQPADDSAGPAPRTEGVEGPDGADGAGDAPEPVDEDEPGQEETSEEPSAAFPSFGVVFQAPDLSDVPRRRSRRATSAVTTPAERPAEQPQEPEQAADREDGAEGEDTDTSGDDAGSRSGRRRRRGGKGRRRGASGEQGDDPADADSEGGSDDANQTEGGTDADQTGGGGTAASGRRSRRGRRSGQQAAEEASTPATAQDDGEDGSDADDDTGTSGGTRRRRRRRRTGESGASERPARDEVTSVKGSTRLEAKRQRRREGREAGRRRTIITEAEFLARRESVDRVMVVRGLEDRTQIAVLEDGVPVEHYVSRSAQSTMAGNVYLGRVQNVLPSMEAAFVDIGKGRNAVLYAGEVNWDAAGLSSGEPKRIENALKAGASVLVQVTKDPIGHKGARLTSQISLPGRYLVYVPGNSMTGISRKLPDTERTRLKKILKEVVPADAGVIVRTAAEGASEAELRADVERLTATWERISNAAKQKSSNAPALLHGEPDMTVRVIRDVFTEDFSKLVVSGEQAWTEVKRYIDDVAPDLADRVEKHTGTTDVFSTYRVHEAIAKAMDRKVWLPSGGSLVIDRTEAMTVVDVNTGKFTGSGGNLEETVTKNNIEAAEEIVRQLRLRDIGGIIVIDFIDMVLESNRDLVVRRLLECLGRDRTKHQVAEVTSLGLVQMTRKRVGSGLIEVFSEPCAHCNGRGVHVQAEPVQRSGNGGGGSGEDSSGGSRRGRGKGRSGSSAPSGGTEPKNVLPTPNPNGPTPAQIAAAAHAAALQAGASSDAANAAAQAAATEVAPEAAAAVESQEGAVEVRSDQTPSGDAPTAAAAAPAEDVAGSGADGEAGPQADAPEAPSTTGRARGRAAKATTATKAAAKRGTARRASKAAAAVTEPGETASAEQAAPATAAEQPAAATAPEQPAPAPATAPEQPAPASPPAAEQPAPAPKRRRRGRAVAPAGPPAAGSEGATDPDGS
ncbi:ribonuclease E/G [Ornithinimicrobium pekingense]|uniref:S1 motif domain-containing protein n=1 Tax=Ornithinimicrobium pekingense TaxID=384677 RepID=A0ABQ2F4S1_9MICO|nr:ribonuclease E/G [Ornithinimicrobium pekingense]GGK61902.1 hypothetical protein GCM10011509_07890 [Ornithinimicrobium pekingense]